MRKALHSFFVIPREILPEFWQDTLHKNRVSLLVICIMIFGMELFNMARVLFMSNSGLGTLNNRIYFGLYCSLFTAACLSLVLQHALRHASVRTQWAVQFGSVIFFFVWHICLNAYDLLREPDNMSFVYITALLGLAIFIQMPSAFGAGCFGLGHVLFLVLAGPYLSTGVKLNLTFTAIVALAISVTRSHHAMIELSQRQEIQRINTQLQELSQKDPLTGLLNRAAFQSCVERSLRQATEEASLALLMVDLDDFKRINDSYGHPCGDFVLQETAYRMKGVFSDAQGVGRVGGDEFMLLLSGARNCAELECQSRRLIREIADIRWKNHPVGASCSMGICISRRGGSYDALYREADSAMYEAKRNGKGRFYIIEI